MFCKNCGKELPDSAKFCSGCGTPTAEAPIPEVAPEVVAEAAPEVVAEATPEVVAETAPETVAKAAPEPVSEPPLEPAAASAPVDAAPPAEPVPAAEEKAPILTGKKKNGKTFAILGLAAVVVIALIFAIVKLVGGSSGKAAYAYITDDNELMFLRNLKEKTEAQELSDELNSGSRVYFSKDGKFIYFIEEDSLDSYSSTGTLYRMEISKIGKEGERPEKISSDVSKYSTIRMLDNGNVLYMKSDDDSYQLRLYDGTESHKLASDLSSGFSLSEDQKYVYFTEEEYDGDFTTYRLYRMEVKPDGQKDRLLKDVNTIYSAYNAETLVYGIADMDEDYNVTYTIYSATADGESTKLAKDVADLFGLEVDGSNVSFSYTLRHPETVTLYSLVTDNMAASDAAITEPVYPDYWTYLVSTVEQDDTGNWYYMDWYGETHPLELNDDIAMSYGLDPDALNSQDLPIIYEAAERSLELAYDEAYATYNEEWESWVEARDRIYLREELKNREYETASFSLHHYANGESTDIASDLLSSTPMNSVENKIYLYKKAGESASKVDLSELDYADEVYYMQDAGSSWYQNINGAESELELEEDNSTVLRMYALGSNDIVLALREDGDVFLNSYTVENNALKFASTLVEDEFTMPIWSGKDEAALYFFTDISDEQDSADVYCYSNGKAEKIVNEVSSLIVLDDADTVYAISEPEYDDRSGETVGAFSILKDGKLTTIDDEMSISRFIFLDDSQVLFLSDGDLKLWNGKENRQIARDVVTFFASSQEGYTRYSIYDVYENYETTSESWD